MIIVSMSTNITRAVRFAMEYLNAGPTNDLGLEVSAKTERSHVFLRLVKTLKILKTQGADCRTAIPG